MALEIHTDRPTDRPDPPPQPQPASPAWVVVDCVALVGLFVLMSLRLLSIEAGLPWIALVLAARIPTRKGSGAASFLLPIAATIAAWRYRS